MFHPPLRPSPQEKDHIIALGHKTDGEFVPSVIYCIGRGLWRPEQKRVEGGIKGAIDLYGIQSFRRVYSDGYPVISGTDNGVGIIFLAAPGLDPDGEFIGRSGNRVPHLPDSGVMGCIAVKIFLCIAARMYATGAVNLSIFDLIFRPIIISLGRLLRSAFVIPQPPVVADLNFSDAKMVIRATLKTGIEEDVPRTLLLRRR